MSIILAGDRSGTGKTTLTLALLAALKQRDSPGRLRDRTVQSFKVGPDYIDPMFHATITGRPCYSLDTVLTSESYVQQSFHTHCTAVDNVVIEGVMGLFDGATGVDDTASTAHVARLLNLPVLLVVDCGRMSRSLAALVQGYRDFDARVNVVGVVLNRVGSDRHLQLLRNALAAIDMPIFGVFRREKDIQLPDRHLGLVPTGEIEGFDKISDRLAVLGERCFDWEKLERLWLASGKIESRKEREEKGRRGEKVRIAIAHDKAFNFYYPDNFETLEAQGAELIYWSPLKDSSLPDASGFYFGGGFPEVFAADLSANGPMIAAIRQAIQQGMPTYAECGGLMYLSDSIVDFDGRAWPMVGVIPQTVKMGGRLALGYREAIALTNGPLLTQSQTVIGHEFHRSSIVEPLKQPIYKTRRYWGEADDAQLEGYYLPHLHASYTHLHWGHRPDIAQRFVQQCAAYAAQPVGSQ
ncbi:MAG: cobyrinic acid a,c-diamide synthase [Phormidesmis priestleyi]|uniref:Cobyrinate a,c-diamide synthase n=1 Tax=Phormidesmis priestleyi TaxID=268141 RepID=A0A2W4WVR4_9CYAN|nr:MAG: cobyrinic acid a,c-diamide synthase [Phormidesmis priestleyi]